MTPQRWQQIERLVQEVLELDPAEREALLDQRCDGDSALREEVESLLSSTQCSRNFLNGNAWQNNVDLFQDSESESLSQRQIGHYLIQEKIGAGGMGEVYLAEDLRLNRRVALKLFDPVQNVDRTTHARFIREAQLAAALEHPNICAIHEVGELEGRPFMAMQFVEGRTVSALVTEGPLGMNRLVPIACEIADAIAAAHARGIIHRDITSRNIMVTAGDHVKVLDFGLAKLLEPDANSAQLELTSAGEVKGTPSFMSPEQARGEQLDQRSDIFSFGVVLYELATGQKPFGGKTRADVISAILKDAPQHTKTVNDKISLRLSAVIDKALAKDPNHRYQNMTDMIAALQVAGESTPDDDPNLFQKLKSHSTHTTIAIITLLIVALGLWLLLTRRQTDPSPNPIKSIAVLPFKPLVAENRDEALEMGMADTLIARLSNIREIEVRPISAVRRYVALDQDPAAAGREQTVDAVLDGSIQKTTDKVRVTVRLVRVKDGATLWTSTFDDRLTDIFAVEDSISNRVAQLLALTLSGEEKSLVAQHSTTDPEAYQLYLKGRYFCSKRTGESIKTSIDYFNQAIAKDPNYALAYAGLAGSYLLLSNYNVTTPLEAYSKARAAVLNALNKDETLAEAHRALGSIKCSYDWDFAGAEVEYKRAIEINPNYADAHFAYGEYLGFMGRLNEALIETKRAQQLDPLSLSINTELGSILYFSGRFDEAIDQVQKTLELEPRHVRAYIELAIALRQKQKDQEAIAALKKGLEVDPQESYALSQLALTYGLIGKKEDAAKVIDQLKEVSKRQYVLPSDMAAAYVGLGDKERAFEWLEKAYRDRDDGIPFLNVDPSWDTVRSDERFKDIVRRVGLPQR